MTDQGGEFVGLKKLGEKYGFHYYTSRQPDTKAAIAERVIRTLKGKLYRYMTASHGYKYLDKLDEVVRAYNTTVHSSTGLPPSGGNRSVEEKVRKTLFPPERKTRRFKHPIGDTVRIVKAPGMRKLGYVPNWRREIFTIEKQIASDPVRYELKDAKNRVIEGTFYEPELQKVKDPGVYRVQKILRSKKVKGKTHYLIRWAGHGPEYDSWEPKSNIVVGGKP